jgi:Transposase DDE domain
MPHLQGIGRNQTLQFPPRLDDYISAENPVRFLDAFVDQLDLQAMGFSRVEAAVEGRRITRWVDEHLLEEMAQRLKAHPEYRMERSSLVEHPFGTLKRGMNQGYFLLKGLEKVRGEFSLSTLAYNLKRVFNLLRVEKLIVAVTMKAIA